MTLKELADALGVQLVRETSWGGFLYRPDPNGVSGPSPSMVQVHPDGSVRVWPEAMEDDTPETEDLGYYEGYPSLEAFYEASLQGLIDEQIGDFGDGNEEPKQLAHAIVTHMWMLGWRPREGRIYHRDNTFGHDTWLDAIKACIDVASEV